MDSSTIINVLLVIVGGAQVVWGIIAFFAGIFVKGLREDFRDYNKSLVALTKAVAEFQLEVHKTFVTKVEAEPRWKRLHDISNDVVGIKAIEQQRSGGAE